MWALLCRAKRSSTSASSKARSRRRAVCNEGVGSDALMFPSPVGGRPIRHPMRVTRNGFSRRPDRRVRSSADGSGRKDRIAARTVAAKRAPRP
ncbi:exported protein of unknown function [Streptomyces murinus]